MTFLYILVAILLLAILIVVHELGHFWAARLTRIEVSEFGVGFGPKLFSWKSRKHDTTFVIRAIPLGGYNAFFGEDQEDAAGPLVKRDNPDASDGKDAAEISGTEDGAGLRRRRIREKAAASEGTAPATAGETPTAAAAGTAIAPDDPRRFENQSLPRRMFVIAMGPVMNFLLAFLLATGYYWISGIATVTGVDPYISSVNAAGPAYEAGLEAGDIIMEINGVSMLDGTTDTLLKTIGSYEQGQPPLELTVRRGEETLRLTMTPAWNEEEERMMVGVLIGGMYRLETEKTTLIGAASASAQMCWRAAGMILTALKNLVTTGEGLDQTSGPVGIISIVSQEVASGGFQAFLELLITISINLGLMNLLPIPGLDGSKLVLGLLEAVRGKPLPREKEAIVNTVGVVILLGLMVILTFKDVLNLFR